MTRVVVITGGTSGLGADVADRLLDSGATVVRAGLSPATTASPWIEVDVRDAAAVEEMFVRVAADFGRLDGVVAAAGITRIAESSIELSDQEWDAVVGVNLTGCGTPRGRPSEE